MYRLFLPSTKSILVTIILTLLFVSSMSFLAYQSDNYFGSGPHLDSFHPNNFVLTPDGTAYWIERQFPSNPDMSDLGDLNADKDAIRLAQYRGGKIKYFTLIDQAFATEITGNGPSSQYYSYLKMENVGQELWVLFMPEYFNYLMYIMRIRISDSTLQLSMTALESPEGYAFFESTIADDGSKLYLSLIEPDLKELERDTAFIQLGVDTLSQIYPLNPQTNHSAVVSLDLSSLSFEDVDHQILLSPIFKQIYSQYPLQSNIDDIPYPIDTVLDSSIASQIEYHFGYYLSSKEISRETIIQLFSESLPNPELIDLSTLNMLPGVFSVLQLEQDNNENVFFSGRQVIQGSNGTIIQSPSDFFVYDFSDHTIRNWDLSDIPRFAMSAPVHYNYDPTTGLILYLINNYDYGIRASAAYKTIVNNASNFYSWYGSSDKNKLFIGWFNPLSANSSEPGSTSTVYQPSDWSKISDINSELPRLLYLYESSVEFDPRVIFGTRHSVLQIFKFQGESYYSLAYSDTKLLTSGSTLPINEEPYHMSLFSSYGKISDLITGANPNSHEVLKADGPDVDIPRNGGIIGSLAIPNNENIEFLYFYSVQVQQRFVDYFTSDNYILILSSEEVDSR